MIPAALCWIAGSFLLLLGLAAAASAGAACGKNGLDLALAVLDARIAFIAVILGALLWRAA